MKKLAAFAVVLAVSACMATPKEAEAWGLRVGTKVSAVFLKDGTQALPLAVTMLLHQGEGMEVTRIDGSLVTLTYRDSGVGGLFNQITVDLDNVRMWAESPER